MMNIYYSKSMRGFYSKEIHGLNIPIDCVEITAAQHAHLLSQQSSGKMIASDENGFPTLIDMPQPSAEEIRASVKKNRQKAYHQEADPLFFKAQRGEATLQEWQDKIAEIKARFPKE